MRSSTLALSLTGSLLAAMAVGCGSPAQPESSATPPAPPPSPSAAPAVPAPAPAQRQKVVVAIEVDQLSAWVAAQRFAELPKTGGFARLLRDGTWVKNLRYPYAVTDTAPGHASLHTGRVPAESGIFGNEVPDASGKRISILRDDSVRVVTPDAVLPSPGSSAARLRVETVADRLRAAHPDAFVVSVSLKDRGSILPAGKHPTHAIWFDTGADSFVTSTAFEPKFPAWASKIGSHEEVVRARSTPWSLTDPAWVKAHAASPDDAPGEGDIDGMGTTFPHVAKSPAGYRALPASDEAIFQLMLAAVGAEYDAARPTLLLLSMSASDIVGHTYGPDSWEAWDHLLALDTKLGAFFTDLEKRVGSFSVLLSADHGNVSMPEAREARAKLPACGPQAKPDAYARPCQGGARLGPNALRDELKAAAKTALGAGEWIQGMADPYVFLTPAARALPADRRAKLDRTVHATLEKHKDTVAEIIDVPVLAEKCPKVLAAARGIPERALPGEDTFTLVCRAWPAFPDSGAGDYYVVPKPGSFFDAEIVLGKGSSHGTPYLYDRTVPMIVVGSGIEAGAVVDDPVDFTAFSALEAAFVGLDKRAPNEILGSLRAKPR